MRRIVAEHGGSIDLTDNAPKGTRFTRWNCRVNSPSVTMPSILLVDDEPGVRSALGGVLRDEGYEVDAVDSGEACLERLGRQAYDVVVLDIWLPGMDGLATFARMRERQIDRRSS